MPEDIHDRDETGRRSRPSDPWLAAAIVATLAVVSLGLLLGGDFIEGIGFERVEVETPADSSADELVVVVARTPGGPGEWSNFARVIAHLSEEIGSPMAVRYVPREDQAADIVRDEEADIAFLCGHVYLDLEAAGLVEAVAVPVVDGRAESTMQLIVGEDWDADCFEDLAGARIAVSDKSSLGGQAYLLWLCAEHDVAPEEHFDEVVTGETMKENIASLTDGDVDATIVNTVQYAGPMPPGFHVVEESPPSGAPPVVVSTSMDEALEDRITRALLAFDAEEVLPPESRIDGFVPVDEVDYSFGRVLSRQCESHGHVR